MSETIYYPAATTLLNPNTTVTGNATIYQNLTAQGAYLTPSPSNAAIIVQWMTNLTDSYASTGSLGMPFWSNIASPPLVSNVAGPWGGVFLCNGPDGRVWSFATNNNNLVWIFNPYTNTTTSLTSGISIGNGEWGIFPLPDGRICLPTFFTNGISVINTCTGLGSTYSVPAGFTTVPIEFGGGALMYNGNVFVPGKKFANGFIFNTTTNTTSNALFSGSTTLEWTGAATDPTGNVVITNSGNALIGIYNPINGQFSTIATPGTFWGAQVVPSGNVVCFPYSYNYVGEYNPFTRTFSTFANTSAGSANYRGGCLLPDGTVAMGNGSQIGLYNYKSKTFTSFTPAIQFGADMRLCIDGRLLSSYNNNVVAISGINRPVPPEFLLHPFFNRS